MLYSIGARRVICITCVDVVRLSCRSFYMDSRLCKAVLEDYVSASRTCFRFFCIFALCDTGVNIHYLKAFDVLIFMVCLQKMRMQDEDHKNALCISLGGEGKS